MSSSVRHLVLTALSWLFVAGCGVVSLVYYPEVKSTLIWSLGLPSPASIATATAVSRDHQSSPVAESSAQSGREPATSSSFGRSVELRAGAGGHFSTSASVNGRSIDVMVDTGATIVALTWEDAQRAGIFVRAADFTGRVSTANGSARVAPVTIDSISIGDITVRNVRGVVAEDGNLATTLLGMSFLGKLSRAEMRRGSLVLEE